jgi:hypothetical protein
VHSRFHCFARVFPAKRLDLKSLKGQRKAEELEPPWFKLLKFSLPLKDLWVEPFLKKNWCKTAEPRVHHGGTDLASLKRGSVQPGCILEVCGSGVYIPPYDFLNLYAIFDSRFCQSFS